MSITADETYASGDQALAAGECAVSGRSAATTARGSARARPVDVRICRVFPGLPEQVKKARVFVARRLDGWPLTDIENVLECVSELVTNAIRHTRSGVVYPDEKLDGDHGRFALTLEVAGPLVWVEVKDGGKPTGDSPMAVGCLDSGNIETLEDDELTVGGLGLCLVAYFSEGHWGFHETDYGRRTWFFYRQGAVL